MTENDLPESEQIEPTQIEQSSDSSAEMQYKVGDIIESHRREVIVEDGNDKDVRILIKKHNVTKNLVEFGVIVDAIAQDEHGRSAGKIKMCIPLPSKTWEQAAKDCGVESILRDGVIKMQAQEQRKQIAKQLVSGVEAGMGMIHQAKVAAAKGVGISNILKFASPHKNHNLPPSAG